MTEKKDFNSQSKQLVSIVDFIKWTSTFGEGAIRQMETPFSGVRLSAAVTGFFGMARDDAGLMLVMSTREGAWLRDLPIECAFIGFDDELLIATQPVDILGIGFQRVGIGVFVPTPQQRADIASNTLIGFGLLHEQDGAVERVNKIIHLYTPERYDAQRLAHPGDSRSLFS